MISKSVFNFVVKPSCYDIYSPSNTLTISTFVLEFHVPFLLGSDGFTFINLKLSCYDHFIFLFSSYFIWNLTHPVFPFLAYSSVSDIYLSPSLFLDSVSSYSQLFQLHLTHCVYLDCINVDACIFVAYYYSSAFLIEHVTMFLFEARCREWPNTLWMHQLWVNC